MIVFVVILSEKQATVLPPIHTVRVLLEHG